MTDLLVFVHQRLAGSLRRDGGGEVVFGYDEQYLRTPFSTPLSTSMPLDIREYPALVWLDGLLPDNRQVRANWAARKGAASTHPVDLLSTSIGLDCAGAVQLCPPHADGLVAQQSSGVQWLDEKKIEQWIQEAKRDWTGGGSPGGHGRFSLGGEQAKCALHCNDGQWGAPYGQTPTTHILKPGLESLDNADVVEHVCLDAASRLGISAAKSEIRHFGSERVLVVERFDRVHGAQSVERKHQEDLCQALGMTTGHKYQSDGGPKPEDIANLLRQESAGPQEDIGKFMQALIYNFAIAAPDGHAKNYSITLDDNVIRLTPLYDLISYFPYKQSTRYRELTTAMKVGRDYTLGRCTKISAWKQCAERLGANLDETVDSLRHILSNVPSAIADSVSALDRPERNLPEVQDLQEHVGRWAPVAATDLGVSPGSAGTTAAALPSGLAQRRRTPTLPVLCGAAVVGGKRCKRRLLEKPCPLHPNSPGSREVMAR